MKDSPYLYLSSDSNTESKRAIIVLPEIFGLNAFVKSVADRAARDLDAVGIGLDHFYAANGQTNTIPYEEHDTGVALMSQVTGETYLELLRTSIDSILAAYPSVQEIVMIGFCFGGKLAYLSGVDARVTTIVSFYGGASLADNFYKGESAVEALVKARQDDADVRVLGLFGEQDEMIPLSDREGIHDALSTAGITCEIHTYPAGHAFFNHDRSDRYVAPAAKAAWPDVVKFVSA